MWKWNLVQIAKPLRIKLKVPTGYVQEGMANKAGLPQFLLTTLAAENANFLEIY